MVTLGIGLAENIFALHGVNNNGTVVWVNPCT